jgi:hypothetical protein
MNKKVFEVTTVVTHKGVFRKFLKHYIVVADKIPRTVDDLMVVGMMGMENEELVEARQLTHYEVIIK